MSMQTVGKQRQAASRLAVETGVKACRGCGVVLPLGDFPPDKKSPHLGAARCWVCSRARRRAYYRQNIVKIAESNRIYSAAHRDKNRAYLREYYRTNRDVAIAKQLPHRQKRRALEVRAVCGCVTAQALAAMAEALNGECVYCGDPFEHWDHAVPLSRGGLHCLDNLVPACAPCNLSKRTQTQEQFMARAGLIS